MGIRTTLRKKQVIPPRLLSLPFTLLVYAVMLLGVVVTVFPFLVSLSTSLKPEEYALMFPPSLWSPEWTLKNYAHAWKIAGFSKYTVNTLIFALATGVGSTLFSALGGYTFGRMRFPGRDQMFGIVLATMMIPGMVTMIPLFYLMIRFPLVGGNNILGQGGSGFYNTWGGLILPGLFGFSTVFLMRQFFKTLPRELEDAARIDGCAELGIFWRVMLPLAKPGLVTVFLFQFTDSWNSFAWPLIITRTPDFYTLQVGLRVFNMPGQYLGTVPSRQAAAVMTILPILVLFIVGQRYFRQGIALTGLK